MKIIECENISKAYPADFRGKKKQNALVDFNLGVEQGEVLGIVGPNGAGKSTLIKILMGFIRPDNGNAFVAKQNVANRNVHKLVGYLPENPCLYPHLSVTDHLMFAARTERYFRAHVGKRIDEILTVVGLNQYARKPIKSFSKGLTQRAALAYALFLEPKILILDEPMSGLDPLGRHLVVDIIKNYQKSGTTILFCSHILSDVEHICTRIGIMNKGEMKTMITSSELQSMIADSSTDITGLESFFLKTIT